MAPRITNFANLDFVAEAFEPATKEFMYSTFSVIEKDDSMYFGQLPIPKLKITLKEYEDALVRVPDTEIYPEFPASGELTRAPADLQSHLYLKRPRLFEYEEYKADGAVDIIPALLLKEARTLEALSKHAHPRIVTYHGCRVQRGLITGLVLDRHPNDLKQYVRDGVGQLDQESFMAELDSAVSHLHSLGYAHNDINPRNILVDYTGMPVLTDFDSCSPVGQELKYSKGTPGWTDPADSY